MSRYLKTLTCGCDVYGSAFGFYAVATRESGPLCCDIDLSEDMPQPHPWQVPPVEPPVAKSVPPLELANLDIHKRPA